MPTRFDHNTEHAGGRDVRHTLSMLAGVLLLLCTDAHAGKYWGTAEYPPPLSGLNELREQWSQESYIKPYWEMSKGRNQIFDLHRARKYKEAIESAERWLSSFPIDTDVHEVKALSHLNLGEHQHYFRHMAWHNGLLASITSTGDGTSAKSAWRVIAIYEEDFVIRALGGKVTGRELVDAGEKVYEKVAYEMQGRPMSAYFDVTVPLSLLHNAFGKRGTAPVPGAPEKSKKP
jgi:hypothetical protein